MFWLFDCLDSREKAFIHAISTAGVVYSVTRACTKGELSQCGCDDKVKSQDVQGKWDWGGCSDDIYYGAEFSRRFIDSIEDPNQSEGVMNLHNNEAGRRVSKIIQSIHIRLLSFVIEFFFLKISSLHSFFRSKNLIDF